MALVPYVDACTLSDDSFNIPPRLFPLPGNSWIPNPEFETSRILKITETDERNGFRKTEQRTEFANGDWRVNTSTDEGGRISRHEVRQGDKYGRWNNVRDAAADDGSWEHALERFDGFNTLCDFQKRGPRDLFDKRVRFAKNTDGDWRQHMETRYANGYSKCEDQCGAADGYYKRLMTTNNGKGRKKTVQEEKPPNYVNNPFSLPYGYSWIKLWRFTHQPDTYHCKTIQFTLRFFYFRHKFIWIEWNYKQYVVPTCKGYVCFLYYLFRDFDNILNILKI